MLRAGVDQFVSEKLMKVHSVPVLQWRKSLEGVGISLGGDSSRHEECFWNRKTSRLGWFDGQWSPSHRFEKGFWTGKITVSSSSKGFISLSTAVFYWCSLKSSSLVCIEELIWRACACRLAVPSHCHRVSLQPKGGNGNMSKQSDS